MPFSNSPEITTAGNTSGDDDDDDRGNSLGFRIPSANSISSMRMSISSPIYSLSPTPSQSSVLSLSPASSTLSIGYLSGTAFDPKKKKKSKRNAWYRKKMTIGLAVLLVFFVSMNWWMLSRIQEPSRTRGDIKVKLLKANSTTVFIKDELQQLGRGKKPQKTIYARLLAKAAHALAETNIVSPISEGKSGYIMVTANGGINQQRVAVCNAVAIARLLNATLVLPKFMYSSVWKDASQFGDIYQEEHFINYLKPDIPIVKDLPKELQSLDLEAIGSLRLRCRCNFHALRFAPKIQEAGALLIQRMRQNNKGLGRLDQYLVGPFAQSRMKAKKVRAAKTSRYLALHLRFEIDMVAHSLCEFGGGEEEIRELEAYREVHFPALVELKKTKKFPFPTQLRSEGLCPLMPEETVLMLAGLGFNRRTHIYLAGAHIYGGNSRLAALTTLFPNLVTKENLLSASEMQPFANFSSQLAALDFIVCTAADLFAMTDSGSQFSSLVAGYRIYYGGGKMPTIRPNKRRLADIFVKNNTIEWKVFEARVRKAVRQNKRVFSRPVGRSVYRYPRCRDCMCHADKA
ncbi:hypothetical protein DH2020_017233 [Rehmannia glutinosa]|uniref:O-fucosyltransferase family protein n=1 Tax=Rehmannia glutinosa TaxID=99300 RepID=A0ABR0WQA0_REHGL